MKYSAHFTFTIASLSEFPQSVEVTLSTDTIGTAFSCDIRDKIIKEINYYFKEEPLKLLAVEYSTVESIMSSLVVTICYIDPRDVPVGRNITFGKKDTDILASGVAVLLLEEFKKFKTLTET